MQTTIDKAGRLVVPRSLRDLIGMTAGPVDVSVVGSTIVIEPIADDRVAERDGRSVIAGRGETITSDQIRELRLGDQR